MESSHQEKFVIAKDHPILKNTGKGQILDSLLANAKVLGYLESTNFGRSNAFNSA